MATSNAGIMVCLSISTLKADLILCIEKIKSISKMPSLTYNNDCGKERLYVKNPTNIV